MAVGHTTKIECDMFYGEYSCPRHIWCDTRRVVTARSNVILFGWTTFSAHTRTRPDGVTKVWTRVDACPICSHLLGKHTLEFLHSLTSTEMADLSSMATKTVSMYGGVLPTHYRNVKGRQL